MGSSSSSHAVEHDYRNRMVPGIRFFYILLLVFAGHVNRCTGQTYEDAFSLHSDKLNNDTYSVDVRPIRNQSNPIYVLVSFELLAIVELNDVSQSFNCNGFVFFFWTDEILVWDPVKYGGKTTMHPQAKNIWRPRVILGNTIEDRDIFADDNAPVIVLYNGSTTWYPGSTFPTSCGLDMIKYPFDEQFCNIMLVSMSHSIEEVQFVPLTNNASVRYFTKNGVWELVSSAITILNVSDGHTSMLSSIMITFHLRRNPTGILINILLPVVFLSFLNLWVFVIPVESGEKIGYGTTVLMALSVFMTTMSAMLPVSAEKLPTVVIYIFILLIISLLTVITSIVIVFLHHKEEQRTHHLMAQANLNQITNKVTLVRNAISAIDNRSSYQKNENKVRPLTPSEDDYDSQPSNVNYTKPRFELRRNKYKTIGKYIDLLSLIIFFAAWLSITLYSFVAVSR